MDFQLLPVFDGFWTPFRKLTIILQKSFKILKKNTYLKAIKIKYKKNRI